MSNPGLLDEITKGASLKHAETVDKSTPHVEGDVKIKKVDRSGFLEEVAKPHDLKHAETVDKSTPQIEKDVHLKKVDREAMPNNFSCSATLSPQASAICAKARRAGPPVSE